MQKINLAAVAFGLSLLAAPSFADDKVPEAMHRPVNSNTTPAATTGKDVPNDPTSDNTSRNSVHNGKAAVSADQQGQSKGDVEITRQIRQAIHKEKGLSINAQNVKIITVQGRVVLKGPVATNDEKAKVESLAASVAGADHMVSEIEVKAK